MIKLNRSIPFFKALAGADRSKQISVLQSFPQFVIDDLNEVLYNIVCGTIKVSNSKFRVLARHSKPLIDLVNTKNKKLMRQVIYKQKGKFMTSLIPIILSTLGSIIGSNL